MILSTSTSVVPLVLSVNNPGTGGVTGLSPTVAFRNATTLDSYLDFDDGTFKASGWGTKYAPLAPSERGHYQRTLDMAAIAASSGDIFVAEYHVAGADFDGDASEVHMVLDNASATDVTFLRKVFTNRLEESPGDPGTLVLYDDDGTTALKSWELTDSDGNAVTSGIGEPARRGPAT